MDDRAKSEAQIRVFRDIELEQSTLNRSIGEGLAPHLLRRKLLQAQAILRHNTVFAHGNEDTAKAHAAQAEADRLSALLGADPETVPDPDGSLPAGRRAVNLHKYRPREETGLQELHSKIGLIETRLSEATLAKDRRAITKELEHLRQEYRQRSAALETLTADDMCSECATVADTHGLLASGPHPDGSGLVRQTTCQAWPGFTAQWARAWQILLQPSATPPIAAPASPPPPPPPRQGTKAWLQQRVAELEAELAKQ